MRVLTDGVREKGMHLRGSITNKETRSVAVPVSWLPFSASKHLPHTRRAHTEEAALRERVNEGKTTAGRQEEPRNREERQKGAKESSKDAGDEGDVIIRGREEREKLIRWQTGGTRYPRPDALSLSVGSPSLYLFHAFLLAIS